MAESGVLGFEIGTRLSIVAPAGTPTPVASDTREDDGQENAYRLPRHGHPLLRRSADVASTQALHGRSTDDRLSRGQPLTRL